MPYDLERIIDDFVFFCFFIGNDFLPHVNTIEIAEGNLDEILDFYKQLLPYLSDYITSRGTINWQRAETYIKMLAKHEKETYMKRISEKAKEVDRDMEMVKESDPTFFKEFEALKHSRSALDAKVSAKLFEKKQKKTYEKKMKHQDKKYKKFLMTKKYVEDEKKRNKLLT